MFKLKFQNDFPILDEKNRIIIKSKNSLLGHYYRHLYQIVGMVANNNGLNYLQKRTYLKQLRAQLSEFEQVLIFYNWMAGIDGGYFGAYWEERLISQKDGKVVLQKEKIVGKNYFFTDYRMIKNVFYQHVFDDYGKTLYRFMYDNLISGKDFKKLDSKEIDNLFDNQDFD